MYKHKLLLAILITTSLIQLYDTALVSSSNNTNSINNIKVLWTYKTSGMIKSSPTIANDYLVVGSRDYNIYCLNSSNGELLWNYLTENEVHSSPKIINNSVFIGSDDGNLYCIDIISGTLVWKSYVGGKIRSSPVIFDDKVYIGSCKHDLFCFNALNGNKLWTYSTLMGVQSSPGISDKILYFASDDYFVYAVNATNGKEIWYTHTGSVFSSPSIYNNQVYIGSLDGYVYCLNASTGVKIWKYKTKDSVSSSPKVAYGMVYVGCEDNDIYCLNATNGEKVWQSSTGFWVCSSPIIFNEKVYVGSQDNNLYCFNAFTGEKIWSYPTGNYIDSSPTIFEENLFVGSSDWKIYAFALNISSNNSISTQTDLQIIWNTIIFDGVFVVTLIIIFFIIIRFVKSNRTREPQNEKNKIKIKKQFWVSKHKESLCVLTILAFSVLFFINLEDGPLWISDEKTYSQWAYYMFKNGDYLTPWRFGELALWIGKPPLLIWLMSFSYQIFGVNNFATRFWSPIFGTISLILVFYLGKKLYNLIVGLISALILGMFSSFYVFARHAMIDVPFISFMLASIYFLIISEKKEKINRYFILGGVFFGLAFMLKQITAILIPLIIFSYFVITQRNVRFFFNKRFAFFWLIALLIVSPWMFYMILRFGPDFWETYFIYSGITRAFSPIEGHLGGPLFYFESLVKNENLFLIGLLLPAISLCTFNSVIKRLKEDTLLLIWIFILFLVFTLAQTKIEWYILPVFPAFAIAISNFLYQLSKKIQKKTKFIYLSLITKILTNNIVTTYEHSNLNTNH